MKRRFSRVLQVLSLLLAFIMMTACGSGAGSLSQGSAESSSGGLVVVDGTSSEGESSLPDASEAGEESGGQSGSSLIELPLIMDSEPAESADSSESSALSMEESRAEDPESGLTSEAEDVPEVDEDGTYTSKEEVAAYIHLYGHLPSNYISKTKAKKLGWDSSYGNLDEVAPGMSIGGGYFGNYEGLLPEGDYRECDIDYEGGYRNAKRIIYSDDGRIYYTEDHYKTFEQLY